MRDWTNWVALVVVVLMLGSIFWVSWVLTEDFKNACHEAGGVVVIPGRGKLCISEDGRIIPIDGYSY